MVNPLKTPEEYLKIANEAKDEKKNLENRLQKLANSDEDYNSQIKILRKEIQRMETKIATNFRFAMTSSNPKETELRARYNQQSNGQAENKKPFVDNSKKAYNDDLERDKLKLEIDDLKGKKKDSKRENIGKNFEFYKDRHGGLIFIILALFIHLIKYGLNFNVGATWIFDVLFAIIVYFFIFTKIDRDSKGLRSIFIILFLEVFLLMILGYFDFLYENKYVQYYLFNRLLTPWWFYFALIYANGANKPSKIIHFFNLLVIAFWIGVILSIPAVSFANVSFPDFANLPQSDKFFDLYEKSKNFWFTQIPSLISDGFKNLGNEWRRQISIATGGYYVGTVDKYQDEPLGVYIDSLRPTAPEFSTDNPVSVSARLRVLTLDDGIKVNVSCYTDTLVRNQKLKASKVYPEEARTYYKQESENIDCIFDAGRFNDRGIHKITVAADFNFETMGYKKSYFMDNERMRALVTEGKDPLREFGITDRNPKSVYTNGPVMIGMKVDDLIGLDEYQSRDYSFGITIEPNTGWSGYIKKLNELLIMVPEAFDLDVHSCTADFDKIENNDYQNQCVEGYKKYHSRQLNDCLDEADISTNHFDYEEGDFYDTALVSDKISDFEKCLINYCKEETEGYNIYSLDVSKNPSEFEDIKEFKTFNCRFSVKDIDEVLENNPIATHYFLSKVRYDYVLEDDVNVQIKQGTTPHKTYEPGSSSCNLKVSQFYEEISEVVELINQKLEVSEINDESLLTECIIASIIFHESCGDPNARSREGAIGLMQLMPTTAEEIVGKILKDNGLKEYAESIGLKRYNLENPKHSILLGTYYFFERLNNVNNKILNENKNKEEILSYALAEYNAGPGSGTSSCRRDNMYIPFNTCLLGNNLIPKETQEYVNEKVLPLNRKCESGESVFHEEIKDPKITKWSERDLELNFYYKVSELNNEARRIYPKQNEEIKKFKNDILNLIDNLYENEDFVQKKKIDSFLNNFIEDITEDNENENENLDSSLRKEITKFNHSILKKVYIKPFEIELDGTNYKLNLSEPSIFNLFLIQTRDDVDYEIKDTKLIYNNLLTTSIDDISANPIRKPMEDGFYIFGNNPFVLVKLEKIENKNALKLSVKYHKGFVINDHDRSIKSWKENYFFEIKLDDDNDLELDVITKGASTLSALDMILRFKDVELCNLKYDESFTNSFCEFDKNNNEEVIGLFLRIKDFDLLFFKAIKTEATFQIEYNPNFKHECCNNPTSCESIETKNINNYLLATCDYEEAQEKNCKITKNQRSGNFYCVS